MTVQRVAVSGRYMDARRLSCLNKAVNRVGIYLGHFRPMAQPLGLGDLSGNRFHIVLRHVLTEQRDTIAQNCDTLRARGFINYFGMQRFGSSKVCANHHVGILLLKGAWRDACHLLLDARDGGTVAVR